MRHLLSFMMAMLLGITVAAAEDAPVCPKVILNGNPTTGYAWTWVVASENDIVEVDGGYAADESAEGLMLVGAGGKYCFTLRGVSEGDAVITFAYARAWETKEPLYTLVYHVHVDAAMNVTILSSAFDW